LPGGKERWRCRWFFEDGWVFVADYYGLSLLTAVDLGAWRVAWNWRPSRPSFGNPLLDLAAGRTLAAALMDRVYLLDRASGRLVGSRAVATDRDRLERSGSVVYLEDTDRKSVSALDLDTGRELWTLRPGGDEVIHALYGFGGGDGGRLLVQGKAPNRRLSTVHFLDVTGRQLWSASVESLGFAHQEWLNRMQWREAGGNVLTGLATGGTGRGIIIGIAEDTGRVLWRRSVADIAPEFKKGQFVDAEFVRGDYRGPLLLRIDSDSDKVLFAALHPATGTILGRALNPAGVTPTALEQLAVSDGHKLYLFDYGARRLVALQMLKKNEGDQQ
jgi:outer membrane protein assembly factor BamB